VPEAEVDLDILNVGFGGVVYRGEMESEAEYNGRGLREADAHTKKYARINIFF
jgi:hypothetical protein